MIELMVVIVIIGLVTALIVAAVGPALQNARIAAQRSTLNQIDNVIQQRVEAIQRLDLTNDARTLVSQNSGLTEKAAELLIRMTLYRQALPQCPEDLGGLDLNLTNAADDAPLGQIWFNLFGSAGSSSDATAQQGSELLWLALTQGAQLRAFPGGKSYSVPVLQTDGIKSTHILTRDLAPNKQISSFVDEWGQPLRFYQWPTRMIRPGGDLTNPPNITANVRILMPTLPEETAVSNNSPLAQCPFDKTGLATTQLMNFSGTSLNTPGGTVTFSPVGTNTAFENQFFTPQTFFQPLVVSSGPDERLGIVDTTEPNMPPGSSGNVAARLGDIDTTSTEFEFITDTITSKQ